MKTKTLFILLTILLATSWSWSQEKESLSLTDSIRVVKTSYNEFQFYVGERKTLSADIETLLMKENKEAYAHFQKAKSQSTNVNLLQFVGGFAIGLPLGSLVFGREPKWEFAAAGVGVLIVSILVHRASYKNYKKAVALYNEGIPLDVSLLTEQVYINLVGSQLSY